MDNVCAHRGGPLGQGVILDGKVVCPWHGWMYDPKTGIPDVNPNLRVAVYPLKLQGDDVLIEL
jgi:nitrite reductase/ring-hydroxylating ferredoxin subunit